MAIMIHYWTNQIEKIMVYYIDKLAFELEYREPSDGIAKFCILRIGDSKFMFASSIFSEDFLDRKDQLVLEQISKRIGSPGPISVYIGMDNIDDYYKQVKNQLAEIIEPIWDTPWRLRQFSTIDPDGNIATFFLNT